LYTGGFELKKLFIIGIVLSLLVTTSIYAWGNYISNKYEKSWYNEDRNSYSYVTRYYDEESGVVIHASPSGLQTIKVGSGTIYSK
jgi:hypothetical protein